MVFLVFFINTTVIAKPVLKNIRISKEDLETRLVLDLSETTKYKVFTLNRPNRVVVDLYRSNKSSNVKSTIGKKGLISKVRIANNTSTKLRVVIETEDIVFYKTSHIPSGSNTNFRVVIDLKKAYEGSRKLVSAALNKKKMIRELRAKNDFHELSINQYSKVLLTGYYKDKALLFDLIN